MSLRGRVGKLEAAVGSRCPGPPIEFRTGTRAELDATPSPQVCSRCGRPPSEHPPGVWFVNVVIPATEAEGAA